jgi:hypothetical protein
MIFNDLECKLAPVLIFTLKNFYAHMIVCKHMFVSQFISDNFSKCIDPSKTPIPNLPIQLKKACLNFTLNSCAQSMALNITYNDVSIVNFDITVNNSTNICTDGTATSGLIQCITFPTLIISPAYVKACPVYSMKVLGIVISQTQLQCFESGDKCASQDCNTCTQSPNCGWCGATSSCMAKSLTVGSGGVNGPYCGTCKFGWNVDSAQCTNPDALSGGGSFLGQNVSPGAAAGILIIIITACVGAALVVAFFCGWWNGILCCTRKPYQRYASSSYPVDDDDSIVQDERGLYRLELSTQAQGPAILSHDSQTNVETHADVETVQVVDT